MNVSRKLLPLLWRTLKITAKNELNLEKSFICPRFSCQRRLDHGGVGIAFPILGEDVGFDSN